MTQQGTAGPVELLEGAFSQAKALIAGVRSEQLTQPTPCSEWDVQGLLNHMNESAGYLATFLTGEKPTASGNAGEAYSAITAAALAAVNAPGAMDKKGSGPGGEINGAGMASVIFMDQYIHGWDLAKATGQSLPANERLAEACRAVAENMVSGGRGSGAFAPEVKVADNASTAGKIAGLTGRKP